MKKVTISGQSYDRPITRHELFSQYSRVFDAVLRAYIRIKSLPTIASHPIDDEDPTVRSERLTPDKIHFCCDVEHATEKALDGRPDLQRNFFQLALGETVPTAQRHEVITKCGRLYHARELEPYRYFQLDRYAHRRPR